MICDSGKVSLEYLLLSRQPSESITLSTHTPGAGRTHTPGARLQAAGFSVQGLDDQRGPASENNYFTEMCSGSEAGSYLRLIDFVYHSILGLREINKVCRQAGRLQYAEYRGTSLIRNRTTLGPYSRPMPRALWWS